MRARSIGPWSCRSCWRRPSRVSALCCWASLLRLLRWRTLLLLLRARLLARSRALCLLLLTWRSLLLKIAKCIGEATLLRLTVQL